MLETLTTVTMCAERVGNSTLYVYQAMTVVVLYGSDRAGTLTRALYAPTWHNDRYDGEELHYHTTTLLYVHAELYTVWNRFRSATLAMRYKGYCALPRRL